jgi:hypothetical protein
MLIKLPTSRLLQTSEVASWMLYPDQNSISERKAFRASIARARYLRAHNESKVEKPPHPYIWENSAADELTLIPNPNADGPDIATPILGSEGGDLLSIVSEMLARESETHVEKNPSDLAYRKGYTAGTVLLACYIYDSDVAPGHKSSKARGAAAAAQITGMKIRSVEKFFREFNSVAHLWASYHLCTIQKFLDAEICGILKYTNIGICNDFLDNVDVEIFLNLADQLANYGQQKATAKTALLDGDEVVRFLTKESIRHPLRATVPMIELFLKHYPPGKRDTRA